jgi:hypothetical protein
MVDERLSRDLGWGRYIVLSLSGKLKSGLAHFPAAETTLAVFGEVVIGNGLSVELGLEKFLDLGQGVEPGEDGLGGLSVRQAHVELLAEVGGETGEFTEHGNYDLRSTRFYHG